MTPQGRAIKQVSIDFGDGRTLPFAPCKRGYIPVKEVRSSGSSSGDGDDGATDQLQKEYKRMVACSIHEKFRRKRLARDKGKPRGGEADPNKLFWSQSDTATPTEPENRADAVVKPKADKATLPTCATKLLVSTRYSL